MLILKYVMQDLQFLKVWEIQSTFVNLRDSTILFQTVDVVHRHALSHTRALDFCRLAD